MNKNNLANYIENFNFRDHSWKNVPVSFPNCDLSTINKWQRNQFEAIKMAWLLDSEDNFEILGKTFILNKDLFMVVGTGAMKTFLSLTSLSIITFILLSVIYYLNVRFNLGLSFLYNVFS